MILVRENICGLNMFQRNSSEWMKGKEDAKDRKWANSATHNNFSDRLTNCNWVKKHTRSVMIRRATLFPPQKKRKNHAAVVPDIIRPLRVLREGRRTHPHPLTPTGQPRSVDKPDRAISSWHISFLKVSMFSHCVWTPTYPY